ncbi:4-azaleucine resistance probable transporter AzlC [Desulfonatronum thiosulfatophilum]|uniref:4-azaleucine resistance probable transporter AzlC n=1 Tax=Desulfonatronum thiosulfatophilum TaxID=617002 RepID=A0A1G6E322_9BACT|nr:AzlC family ABC transporter permease [Desulfonatronum thiosulfatophilum]SDB51803.1 4-azaleucine resistance probable transporter AzlC [Desulfonatronum thiosulfatophilum]
MGSSLSPIQFTFAGVRRGFQLCLPLGLSVFAYGLVFGVLAVQAGMSAMQAGAMSLSVFAGASQLMVLEFWGPVLPFLGIVLTTFIVNLRHVLMGAALRDWLTGIAPWKAYGSLFFMTDESWALSMREMAGGGRDAGFLLGSGLCIYVFWFTATCLGASSGYFVGSAMSDPARWGLDFAFTAVFISLLIFFWKGRHDLPVWLVAAGAAWIGVLVLPGKWYILCGGLAGGLYGAWRHER